MMNPKTENESVLLINTRAPSGPSICMKPQYLSVSKEDIHPFFENESKYPIKPFLYNESRKDN